MNFWYNKATVQYRRIAESLNRTVGILMSKISKDLCTVRLSQHRIVAHYKRFEVPRVFQTIHDRIDYDETRVHIDYNFE